MDSPDKVNLLLQSWSDGDEAALEELLPLIEPDLRRLAHLRLKSESANHTLQTTALVNEVFLKLIGQNNAQWENREQFFAIVARVMRRVLCDYARTRLRAKRGNGAERLDLDEVHFLTEEKSAEIVCLDEALDELARIDMLKNRIIELRHFGGLTVEETAAALGIAPITVMRHYGLAKAWLKRELAENFS